MNIPITMSAQQLQSEVARLRRVVADFVDIISNHTIAMQAAVIDASFNDSDKGMSWVRNTLFGPGLFPDIDEAIEMSETNPAQAWFDHKMAAHEAFRAQHPRQETPPWPQGMPPASWDEYAMHEAIRLIPGARVVLPYSQRVNMLHRALTEAMWFAAPGGEPVYASEPTRMLPKIGAVPSSLAESPGICALQRLAESICIIDKKACWDSLAMFEVRDALVAVAGRSDASAASVQLPEIEAVASAVHQAWIEAKLAAGITSRPAADGREQMVPYAQLDNDLQELDRATVRAVYSAIEKTKAHMENAS